MPFKKSLKNPSYNPAGFLDRVISKMGLKNDAALSRTLNIAPPVISKIRTKTLPLGASVAVRIMEECNASIHDLRRWMGVAK